MYKYKGHFKMTSETYMSDLGDVSSSTYKNLSSAVTTEVMSLYVYNVIFQCLLKECNLSVRFSRRTVAYC